MNFISTIQSGDQREQFGIDSEPLLANTQSETTTALIKERTSDLLYQYDRVISSIEESCTEMTTSNAKRLAASDVERLQWTIHLSDCALEMRKSLERAEILVVQIDKKFQNCENDSSASVTYPGNTSKFGSSLPVEKDKTITRDRHRRAFWEQLIRHHSAVKLAQRIGESSSFKLDDYLEYGPKRKTRRPVKQYDEYPLPPIICEYKSAPKYSFNQNDDPNEGVDGRLLVDIEANTAPWTFAQLDEILEDPCPIDYNDKEKMKKRLLDNEEFSNEVDIQQRRTRAAFQCAVAGVMCMVIVLVLALQWDFGLDN